MELEKDKSNSIQAPTVGCLSETLPTHDTRTRSLFEAMRNFQGRDMLHV